MLTWAKISQIHVHLKSNLGRVFAPSASVSTPSPQKEVEEIIRKDSGSLCRLTQLLMDTNVRTGALLTFLITQRIKQPPTDSE